MSNSAIEKAAAAAASRWGRLPTETAAPSTNGDGRDGRAS
jgi:hypothetical protein